MIHSDNPFFGAVNAFTKRNLILVSLVFLFTVTLSLSNADAAIFMKYGDIKGESTTTIPECSDGCITLDSFQFGLERAFSSSGGSGGRTSSSPSLSDVLVTKDLDSTSPKFFDEAVSGKAMNVEMFLVRSGGTPQVFAKYVLTNARVSEYGVSGDAGDTPSEFLGFTYERLETTFTKFVDGEPSETFSFCWDIVRNESCGSGGGQTDSDGDGIPDLNDNCRDDSNANQADTDGDGAGDVCDVCPNDANNDSDRDGVCGDVDNCSIANADQADADSDGRGDVCDNCSQVPNTDQSNDDSDNLGNVCDACPLDPANDADADGVCGDVDACPLDPDNDADGDGICGDVDNCSDAANADQADGDIDGTGDACDACPNDPFNDFDQDGVCGDVDNCLFLSNPGQEDGDGDGLGDACDPFPLCSDATTCNGNGTCDANDSCVCDLGFAGANCNACGSTFYPAVGNADACSIYCLASDTSPTPGLTFGCSSHGTCSLDGACQCFQDAANGFFTGANCSTCSPDFLPS